MLPDCNEVLSLSILIFGVGIGVISQIPAVLLTWYGGRNGWTLRASAQEREREWEARR